MTNTELDNDLYLTTIPNTYTNTAHDNCHRNDCTSAKHPDVKTITLVQNRATTTKTARYAPELQDSNLLVLNLK